MTYLIYWYSFYKIWNKYLPLIYLIISPVFALYINILSATASNTSSPSNKQIIINSNNKLNYIPGRKQTAHTVLVNLVSLGGAGYSRKTFYIQMI